MKMTLYRRVLRRFPVIFLIAFLYILYQAIPFELSQLELKQESQIERKSPIKSNRFTLNCPALGRHSNHPSIAVLTLNRPDHLNQTLWQLLCVAGANPERIWIASDAESASDKTTAQLLGDFYGVRVIFDYPPEKAPTKQERLSNHYKFIFDFTFGSHRLAVTWESLTGHKEEYVILWEDDLDPSVDMVDYFTGMSRNAYPATATDAGAFYRGSHFMALGWMTSRLQYQKVERTPGVSDWDAGFVGAMRDKELACVYPEVPRVHHRRGDSSKAYSTSAYFQRDRLDNMALNAVLDDVDYGIVSRDRYDEEIEKFTARAVWINEASQLFAYRDSELVLNCGRDCARVMETTMNVFGQGYDGIIRGLYRGIVRMRFATNAVLLITQDADWIEMKESTSIPVISPFPPSPVNPAPSIIVSDVNESCASACRNQRMECREDLMPFLNRCEWLEQRFGCRKGCKANEDFSSPAVDFSDSSDFCWTTLVRRFSCVNELNEKHAVCACA